MVVTRFVFIYRLADDRYLLLNSLTGAVDVVEGHVPEALAALRRGEPHGLKPAEVEAMLERGHLYRSREEEQDKVNLLVKVSQVRRAREHPISFILCPTMICNLRCPYCFEPEELHKKGGVMTLAQVDSAFAAVDQIRAMRTDAPLACVNLFGGEPLLPSTRPVVGRMLEHASERDLPVAITSNGTHSREFLPVLAPHRERILFDITMDGLKELHDKRRILANGKGTFDRITANIRLLLGEGFRVNVRMNLDASNVDSVNGFLEYVRDQGWHRYSNFETSVSPVTNYTGRGGDNVLSAPEVEARIQRNVAEALRKEVRLSLNGDFARLNLPVSEALGENGRSGRFLPSISYCEAAGAHFYCMGPDDLIYPCNQIIGDKEWAIGSYHPGFSLNAEAAALWHGRVVTNMPQCMECNIAFLCAGGCPVMAKRTTGSPMSSYCGTSKKELKTYLDSVAPRLLELAGGEAAPQVETVE